MAAGLEPLETFLPGSSFVSFFTLWLILEGLTVGLRLPTIWQSQRCHTFHMVTIFHESIRETTISEDFAQTWPSITLATVENSLRACPDSIPSIIA